MFGLFEKKTFEDPVLGTLTRTHGLWRGALEVDEATVPLALAGNGDAPDAATLAEAHELRQHLHDWRTPIAQALFHHYEPYAEAADAGALPGPEDGDLPRIASLADVAPHVQMEYIHIAPQGDAVVTELGYSTAWDTEHTLGLRFSGGRFLELCGSTLAP